MGRPKGSKNRKPSKFYIWCLENNREDLIKAWNEDKNGDIKNAVLNKDYYFTINPKYDDIKTRPSYIINKKKSSDPFDKYYNSIGYYLTTLEENGYEKYWSKRNKESAFNVSKGAGKYIYINCVKKDYHADYKIKGYSFYSGNRCPYCAGKIIHPNDSFAAYNKNRLGNDFEKYWHKDNTIDPFSISPFKNKGEIIIQCQNVDYHVFKTTPANFSMGSTCPYCRINSDVTHPKDSLGAKYPDIVEIWSNKNKKTPFEYRPTSHQFAWFKCENGIHDDYKRLISDTKMFRWCPECVKHQRYSKYEQKTYEYLVSLGYHVLRENNCTIYAINPQTNMPLRYDNEIPELKMIVEVNGIQHYELSGWHITQAKVSGKTKEWEFDYQRYRDLIKMDEAIHQGYYYLALPYYLFETDEYKTVIDNEIIKAKEYMSTVETAGFIQ